MSEKITRDEVEQWIEDAGLAYEPALLEEASEYTSEYEWALIERGRTYALVIAHRRKEYNSLFLQIRLSLAEAHTDSLRALDDDTRKLFIYDLRLALLGQPVGFSFEFEEGEGDDDTKVLAHVNLGYNLFEEPIRRAGFLRRTHQMQTAAHTVSTMFQKLKHMGEWP